MCPEHTSASPPSSCARKIELTTHNRRARVANLGSLCHATTQELPPKTPKNWVNKMLAIFPADSDFLPRIPVSFSTCRAGCIVVLRGTSMKPWKRVARFTEATATFSPAMRRRALGVFALSDCPKDDSASSARSLAKAAARSQ